MKAEKAQASRLQRWGSVLRREAALLLSALSILLSAVGMAHTERVRLEQQRLDGLFQPIIYTLDWEDSPQYRYCLRDGKQTQQFPAKATRIHITRGGIRRITALGFDGKTVRVLNSLEIQAQKEQRGMDAEKISVTVETEPQDPPLTEGRLLYDFFFIWIEALSGEQRLDMICHIIDLDSGQITETLLWSRPQLLEYAPGTPENAKEILLERYWELTQRAEALPDY